MQTLFSLQGTFRIALCVTATLVIGVAVSVAFSTRSTLWAQDGKTVAAKPATIKVAALEKRATAKSGNPIPRFVSLKKGRVNVRRGPSKDYQVSWVFVRKDLPIEIIAEFEQWRRIRDNDGAEGWIFHSLLATKRTALITPWRTKKGTIKLYGTKGDTETAVALAQPGAMGVIGSCDGKWCKFTSQGHSGWLPQKMLWGVYPGEQF